MVMQAYDYSTLGSHINRNSYGYFAEDKFTFKSRASLFNIASQPGPAPYREFKTQSFEKVVLENLSGHFDYWTSFPSGNTWTSESGLGMIPSSAWSFDPAASDRSSALTDSYNDSLEKLNTMIRGNTDLSIDLAQGSKTLRLGQDVLKVVRSLNNLKNPLKMIKAIGNARLTWVYGIKPTLQSIYDAVNFEAKRYNSEFSFTKVRSAKGFTASARNYGGQWPVSYYKDDWFAQGESRTEVGIVLRIPDSPLTQVARLSALNPVSIAWELVPFSFVIDWFYDIGGYLRALETALTYNSYFNRGYRTFTMYTKYTVVAHVNLHNSVEHYTGDWGFILHRKMKSRSPIYAYPMPERPVFNANLGSGRLLNTAALLSTFLAKGKARGGSDYQRAMRGLP